MRLTRLHRGFSQEKRGKKMKKINKRGKMRKDVHKGLGNLTALYHHYKTVVLNKKVDIC